MKWGIIGAMPSEVTLLKQQMQDICEVNVGRQVFWEGILCNQEVVVSSCGIGKVNAAITAQMMIDRFGAQRIINTGIAGAIHHDLKVLDVVVSVSCATTTTMHASCVTIHHTSIPSAQAT